MQTLCIVQARMGSTRLPGKILMEVDDKSILEYEIERLRQSKLIDKIVIATTTNAEDDKTEAFCNKVNIDCFRGSENDVLERYARCAEKYPEFNSILRITGDCPLIDPHVIDELILFFDKEELDYASNTELGRETYPNGVDAEILTRETLARTHEEATLPSDREHVTLYIRNSDKFIKKYIRNAENLSSYRFTVDSKEDFDVVSFLIKNSSITAQFKDYVDLLNENPKIRDINMDIKRNEGLAKSLREDHEV